MAQAEEQALFQRLITHMLVERLDVAILYRLAWDDVMPLDPVLSRSGEDGLPEQRGTVVRHSHPEPPARSIRVPSGPRTTACLRSRHQARRLIFSRPPARFAEAVGPGEPRHLALAPEQHE